MEEFEAAWNIVGIACSWLVAGILASIVAVIATFLWNEWF